MPRRRGRRDARRREAGQIQVTSARRSVHPALKSRGGRYPSRAGRRVGPPGLRQRHQIRRQARVEIDPVDVGRVERLDLDARGEREQERHGHAHGLVPLHRACLSRAADIARVERGAPLSQGWTHGRAARLSATFKDEVVDGHRTGRIVATERDHRFDRGGPPRRQVAGQQRHRPGESRRRRR